MLYKRGGHDRGCSNIMLPCSISFIEISSDSLLFIISLCSAAITFELGSDYSVINETPKFLGFELRKCKRQAHYFSFYFVIRA